MLTDQGRLHPAVASSTPLDTVLLPVSPVTRDEPFLAMSGRQYPHHEQRRLKLMTRAAFVLR